MWAYPDLEEEAITYQADKLSTATNPDVVDSMAISFLLDRYSFPVVLPNSFSPTERSDCSTSSLTSKSAAFSSAPSSSPVCSLSHQDSKTVSSPETPAQGPPSVLRSAAISTKRDCLRRFREESIHYSPILPHYLRNIDWMDRRAVEDVHWLLGNCSPEEVDLTVALELLSMDFPDVMVRRLAVQKLESLSNDDVLKYLLQLIQVCVCIQTNRKSLCLDSENK